MAGLDGDLEGQQVAFAERRLVDDRVQHHPAGLLVVDGEVLGGRGDVVRLDALDGVSGQGPGQQRVLAQVFEVAPVARVAQQVRPAGQQHVEALLAGLLADHRPGGEGGLRVPGRRQRHAGGQRDGVVVLTPGAGDAKARVALGEVWDGEARHAGDIARRHLHARRALAHERRELAVQQGDLVVETELFQHQVRALVRAELGVHPGLGPRRLRGADRQARGGHRQRRDAHAGHQSTVHRHALPPCSDES
jgi:hypothetical protein